MLSWINDLTTYVVEGVNSASGGNEMVAAVLLASIVTIVSSLLYKSPVLIRLIKRNITTSFVINNTTYESEFFIKRMNNWLADKTSEVNSRTLSFNPIEIWRLHGNQEGLEGHKYIGSGYGMHWFIYKNKLIWFNKLRLESSGSEKQKEEYVFMSFGRSHDIFHEMVKEFTYQEENDGVAVYTYESSGWERKKVVPRRELETIVIDSNTLESITDSIENFRNNKDWFVKSALPYKLSYILHGVPGTGKTSLIKAIASHYDMNLCVININSMSDSSFEKALSSVPPNSVLAIEDFDSTNAVKDRGIKTEYKYSSNDKSDNESLVEDDIGDSFGISFLSLSGILNTLDGLIPLDNVLVFLTTNQLENVDPALYRTGRIDHIVEIGKIKHDDIMRYATYMYPDYDFSGITFNETIGYNINEALMYSRGSPARFLESLKLNGVVKQ